MTFEELISARLVFGIPGKKITSEIIQHFKETQAGGLILYRINYESPDQICKLISELEGVLGRRLLVTVDHEGGRVIMFGEGVTVFPSNQTIGQTGNTTYARKQGEQEGRELRRLGIDVNFSPVLDVLTDAYSPAIGIRAYGKDPSVVANMGAARIAAMQVEGLSACAKHFPGIGPATIDPHLNLPTITLGWGELEKTHLIPFARAMRTGVHSLMTSHVLYPKIDDAPKACTTFSRKIVGDYLRKSIGYKGVIFSDDLEMGAVRELVPIGEAAVQAVLAGHDVVLSCHDLNLEKQVAQALHQAAKEKRIPTKDLEDSYQRIQKLQGYRTERFAALPATPARAQREQDDARALVKEICDRSVTILRASPPLSPEVPTLAIVPEISSLADKILIEQDLLDEKSFFDRQYQSLGLKWQTHILSMEPSEEQIASAARAATTAAQTVLWLTDAHLFPSNKNLLEAVSKAARRLAVILLRDPYDVEYVPPNILCMTNYGYRSCDLAAILKRLATMSTVPSN
jgi:beta-N-acetylhexosaminidase